VAVFGLGGALRASTAIANPVINAWNELGRSLRFQVVGTVLTVSAIVVAMPFGLRWVAIAIVTVSFYSFVPYGFALKLLGLGWLRGISILLIPAAAAAVTWLTLTYAKPHVHAAFPGTALALAVLLALSAATYLFTLLSIGSEFRAELRQLVIGRTRG
jgi:hypothetical protein